MRRRDRKRQRMLTEIESLNLVLSTFNLSVEKRTALQRRRLRRIEELARLESVRERLKPWSHRKSS